MLKAIIYDMDGLLVDSMVHWMKLDEEHFGEFGVKLTPEIVKQLTGHSIRENAKWVVENVLLQETVEGYMERRELRINEIYEELSKLMPGVEQLLKFSKTKGLKQAIASGAPLEIIKIITERFSLNDYLHELVGADHVGNIGKPDPAIFLYAAKKLGVKPEECVVLEDAENGVVAAKCAGMKCIAVPDKRWSFGDFSQADLIVNSLEDEKIFKFLDL